ncbi:MAG: phage tail protein, partial [Lachnospiraceae bacterium]|nr:phage tail protein [Lachnospiraceae bacterium]
MAKHGVFVSEMATSAVTPATVETGVPFFIGASPIQNADSPATPGVPVLCTTWNEAVQKLGYSDDWATYPLCEAMYSHFKLYNVSPAIFCNLLDASTMKSAVAAADKNVVSKKVALSKKAIPGSVVVKVQGGTGTAYVKDTDYALYFADEVLTVELLPASTHYSESTLNIAYDEVTP